MIQTVLAGDIGGTKTILRLVSADIGGTGDAVPVLTTLWEKTYPSRRFLIPGFTHRAALMAVREN